MGVGPRFPCEMIMSKHTRRFFVLVASILTLGSSSSAFAAGLEDMFGDVPIVRAVRDGDFGKVNTELLAGTSVNTISATGIPIIVMAASSRSLQMVQILGENGARVDAQAKDSSTALTVAATNGDTAIVNYLLDKHADVNLPGSTHETALIKAVRNKRTETAKALIERNADVEETDATGTTALEFAERNGMKDVAALIKKVSGS